MISLENAIGVLIFGLIALMILGLFFTAQASLFSTSSIVREKVDFERARSEESVSVRWLAGDEILITNRGSRDLTLRYLYVYSKGSRVPTSYVELNMSLEVGESKMINLTSLGFGDIEIARVDAITDLGLVFSSYKPNRLMKGIIGG